MVYKLLSSLFIFLILSFSVAAQEEQQQQQDNADDIFQIFLREPIQDVEKATYENGEELEFQLLDEGTTILLKKYDGKSAVRVTYKSMEGESADMVKPHCHIHPKPPS